MRSQFIPWIRRGDCMIYARQIKDHYPKRKGVRIGRWILRKRFGGIIPKGIVSRHTCDNKHCVNPDHIIAGTDRDNVNDAIERKRYPSKRGTLNSNCKLSESQVYEIKQLAKSNTLSRARIAQRFGVCKGTINAIVYGQNWQHLFARN